MNVLKITNRDAHDHRRESDQKPKNFHFLGAEDDHFFQMQNDYSYSRSLGMLGPPAHSCNCPIS